jgi:hypothetical protein
VLLAVLMLASRPAVADGRSELEKARASFLARNWADAEQRLRVLLHPETGLKERTLVSQARMYLGASLLEQGSTAAAEDMFEKLVLDDPTYEPDPLSFPGEAVNAFIDVRASLLEQIRDAQQAAARLAAERKGREEAERERQRVWLERVKAQAEEERITVRRSRIVASLPFGAGQFQNGQTALGLAFAGGEGLLVVGTIVTFSMYQYARTRENEELQVPGGDSRGLATQYHQRAVDVRLVNLGLGAALVLTAAIGILQAHVSFVPEVVETKKRALPRLAGARPSESSSVHAFTPLLMPLQGPDGAVGGAMVGLSGVTF